MPMSATTAIKNDQEIFPQPSESSTPGRLLCIDVLRGVAAFAVTAFHALSFQPYVGRPGWLGVAIAFFLSWGFLGVYLFFVISGFCIHMRWARQKISGRTPTVQFLSFWKRRIRRLYPAYLVSLTVFVALGLHFGEIHANSFLVLDALLHLFMLHNVVPATTYSLNGVFWTLAVEEQLYLLYFVMLWLRTRFGWRITLGIALSLRVLWFALGFVIHRRWGITFTVTEAAASTWCCWILGAISVEIWVGLVRVPERLRSWLTAGLIFAAMMGVWMADQRHGLRGSFHDFVWLIAQPVWALGFFVILNSMTRVEARLRYGGLSIRLLAWLGLISYSLYLTHEILIKYFARWLSAEFDWSVPQQTMVSIILLSPLSIVFARLFFQYFERPFLNTSPDPAR